MITVIEYKPEHQPYFESLNRVWIEKYFTMEPRDEEILRHPEKTIIEKGGVILVALYEETVAGVVALIRLTDDSFEFSKMGVHENFRRKGIAEALSYAAFEKAKELGASKVVLFSNTLLEPAIQLYRKLGFAEAPLDKFNEYKRSNIKMERTL